MAIQLDPVPKKTAQHKWTGDGRVCLPRLLLPPMPGMVVHACDLSSWEVEAVRLEFKVIVSHTARPPGT